MRIPVPHPKASGIEGNVWEEQSEAIADYTGQLFMNALVTKEQGAILMAHLHEANFQGRPPMRSETAQIAHDDAQLALRLHLQGSDGTPLPLEPPRPRGTPAPTLRPGTEQEAGFKPGTAQALHDLCQAWYDESNEPFVTLVARNGVVLLHQGFGDADQLPQGLDTPMWMASITKAITGMLFAQFVDQGRIRIDDPVGNYLPDFPTTGEQTITLRHCFTHTTGLDGHMAWGGMHNPWLDNVILNGLDYLTPGKIHHYNGMGYDLAGKVMEVNAGKSIFRLFHEHFFQPLGVRHTTIDDLATATLSTAEDIARIGQLLLNRGSYGDLEFFSAETFNQLLPTPLDPFYPDITEIEWGIGLTWMRQPVPDSGETYLSANTIGHGAASSAILRVDLENHVVISQTRNDAGKKYGKHLGQFIRLIHESLQDDSAN
jgi:CubicO group peptidase (beta-lactamase class C family)